MIKSTETDKDRPLIILYVQSFGGHGGGLEKVCNKVKLRLGGHCGLKDLDVKKHDLTEAGLVNKNSPILLREEEIESLGAIPTQVVSKHIGLRVDVGEGGVPDGHLMVYIASTHN